jgi:hypothetical protein
MEFLLSPEVRRELQARIETSITPLHGWGTVEKGIRLAELVLVTQAERSVEIGVFGGRSLIPMAIAHQLSGIGYTVGIDPWEVAASLDGVNAPENEDWWRKIDYDEIYTHFLGALLQYRLVRECRIMREWSDTAVRLFADESIAVLHQDGNHSEKISTMEVDLWSPKLKQGGYWVFDDTDWATTQRAQALLIERGFHVIEIHDNWKVYRKP